MSDPHDPRVVAMRHADDAIAAFCTDRAEQRRASWKHAETEGVVRIDDYGRAYLEAYVGRLEAVAARLRGQRNA